MQEIQCPKCGTDWVLDDQESQKTEFNCSECGWSYSPDDAAKEIRKKNYPALKFISKFNRAIGVLAILFGICLGLFFAFTSGAKGFPAIGVTILYAGFIAITQFAFAELILLFIDVANNTKRTNQLLERIANKKNS
jgi:formate-dependent nitrite reductase membrane component NrfD